MAEKNFIMKQKTEHGYDILFPKTTISQVANLQERLNEKLLKLFTSYPIKSSLAGNDLLIINDSEDNNEDKKITAQSLRDYISDSHNKGYYSTVAALRTAWPSQNCHAGDYAIVGETDTIWIFDDNSNNWVDSDTKGSVTSVNGQTGAVNIPTPGNLSIGASDPVSMSGNIQLSTVAGTGSYNDLSEKPIITKIVVSVNDPSASLNYGDFWYEELS